jgi:hypothetical protein
MEKQRMAIEITAKSERSETARDLLGYLGKHAHEETQKAESGRDIALQDAPTAENGLLLVGISSRFDDR